MAPQSNHGCSCKRALRRQMLGWYNFRSRNSRDSWAQPDAGKRQEAFYTEPQIAHSFFPPELRGGNAMVVNHHHRHLEMNADVYQTSEVLFLGCLGMKACLVRCVTTLGLAMQQNPIICCLREQCKRQMPTFEVRTRSTFRDA